MTIAALAHRSLETESGISKMTLSNGRHIIAAPGPSIMPDRVLQAMHRAAPNIYSGPLIEMVDGLIPDLKTLAGTHHKAAIYIANGHGAWEAALANIIAPGDKVLVPATGRFGFGWGEVASALGAEVEIIDFGKSDAMKSDQIAEVLRTDKAHKIKAVLATHVDTSTSIKNDIPALRRAIDAAGHPALLMVDCIASMGCDRFEMDVWGVDVAVTASQKGLMTPPGLGFVFFNEKAAEKRANLPAVSPYWDWVPRANPEMFYQYFQGTAPTHHLFGLREALTMILHEEGLEAVLERHAVLARAVWAAFDVWAQSGPAKMNVSNPAERSNAVTAVHIGAPDGTALRDYLSGNLGVTLGIGLGMAPPGDPSWHGYFRVGHMGHLNAHMILGTLGAIEAGMKHLGIAHGDGGLAAAAKICSGK